MSLPINALGFQMEKIKLDVGCGDKFHNAKSKGREGYIGIDIMEYGQEILWDFDKDGLPLPDNSCSNIFCSHVIEHVVDAIGLLNEMWRVLEPGGELHLICPEKLNESAYLLHHIRRLDKATFEALDAERTDFDVSQWREEYDILSWKIKSLVVNEKPDIHFVASPAK